MSNVNKMSYLPFWVEVAVYKTSLAQSFFIKVPVTNPVEWAVKHNSMLCSCNDYCNCLIVDRFVMDPKLMDENLIDRLHRPLTKTIHYYLDKLWSIDRSINDMQHITETYIYIYIYINNFNTKCNKLCFCLFVISALSWQSVLLVEETGGPRENHSLTNFIT